MKDAASFARVVQKRRDRPRRIRRANNRNLAEIKLHLPTKDLQFPAIRRRPLDLRFLCKGLHLVSLWAMQNLSANEQREQKERHYERPSRQLCWRRDAGFIF